MWDAHNPLHKPLLRGNEFSNERSCTTPPNPLYKPARFNTIYHVWNRLESLYCCCVFLFRMSSDFVLPPPSSFHQPNPMRAPMRAINSMTLGYVGAPGPSLLLPPSSFLHPKQTPYARPYARPMRAPYARATFINGFRSCTLL